MSSLTRRMVLSALLAGQSPVIGYPRLKLQDDSQTHLRFLPQVMSEAQAKRERKKARKGKQ